MQIFYDYDAIRDFVVEHRSKGDSLEKTLLEAESDFGTKLKPRYPNDPSLKQFITAEYAKLEVKEFGALPAGTIVRIKSGSQGWIRAEIVEYYDVITVPAFKTAFVGGGMTPGYKVRVLEGKHKGEVLSMPMNYLKIFSGGEEGPKFPHIPQKKTPLYPHIPKKHSIMKVRCGWCGKPMGTKEGNGTEGETTAICSECYNKEVKKIREEKHG